MPTEHAIVHAYEHAAAHTCIHSRMHPEHASGRMRPLSPMLPMACGGGPGGRLPRPIFPSRGRRPPSCGKHTSAAGHAHSFGARCRRVPSFHRAGPVLSGSVFPPPFGVRSRLSAQDPPPVGAGREGPGRFPAGDHGTSLVAGCIYLPAPPIRYSPPWPSRSAGGGAAEVHDVFPCTSRRLRRPSSWAHILAGT